MLLFVSLASASSVECGVPLRSDVTVPADGQVGVPVDVVLSATFGGGWNCDAEDWTMELLDGAGAVVASESWSAERVDERRWITLTPGAPLAPEAAYVLRLTSSPRFDQVEEVAFTTGTGAVAGLTGGPTIVGASAAYDDHEGEFTLDWAVAPAADPDALSFVQVQSDDFRMVGYEAPCDTVLVGTDEALAGTCSRGTGFAPAETCLRVRQVDGLGRPTEWSADTCVDVVGGCEGCATGSGGGGGIAVLVAAAAAAAWRRR